MAEVNRLSLTLFMSSPLQREAWRLLQQIPSGQRTEALCLALCREHERNMVLDMVRKELQRETTQTRRERAARPAGVEDADQDVLDFLRSLQKDGGDECA